MSPRHSPSPLGQGPDKLTCHGSLSDPVCHSPGKGGKQSHGEITPPKLQGTLLALGCDPNHTGLVKGHSSPSWRTTPSVQPLPALSLSSLSKLSSGAPQVAAEPTANLPAISPKNTV